jgi:hypothetical protein
VLLESLKLKSLFVGIVDLYWYLTLMPVSACKLSSLMLGRDFGNRFLSGIWV